MARLLTFGGRRVGNRRRSRFGLTLDFTGRDRRRALLLISIDLIEIIEPVTHSSTLSVNSRREILPKTQHVLGNRAKPSSDVVGNILAYNPFRVNSQ